MVKVANGGRRNPFSFWVIMAVEMMLLLSVCSEITPSRKLLQTNFAAPFPAVKLTTERDQVIIDNGLIQVTLSRPYGDVIGVQYNGIKNVLADDNQRHNRGYWDVVWKRDIHEKDNIDRLEMTNFTIITQSNDQIELSFSRLWTNSSQTVPLNVDKRIIVQRGLPGFYVYAILERLEDFPTTEMTQIRVVFKLKKDKFNYMALSDTRQRVMPSEKDRSAQRSQILDYQEAVLLTNPVNPNLRGQVDDKYMYSTESKDNTLHGWTSDDPRVGFWMISPSDEFRVGGPTKQDLTSHVGPTVLNMFSSTHYAGMDMDTNYTQGQAWKKVLGPVMVYLNAVASEADNSTTLWKDAKRQMQEETKNWPYNFVSSEDFPKADQRGQVSGHLVVVDRYVAHEPVYARNGYVGLAAPGSAGSWQRETKGYQFWTQVDREGSFVINNIRPGNYSLYAWVPGVIGDYKADVNITITPGSNITLGLLTFTPPRDGPTLWEIGYPDRSAAEFFIPDPYPTLLNPLYNDQEGYRQYGLWERYADMYPNQDLVYTVGVSDYTKDWFYAQVTRNKGGNIVPTTWRIVFHLDSVSWQGNYTLRLAVAAATYANVRVWFNDQGRYPDFSTGRMGLDNAIARHGIHGLYRLFNIHVPNRRLRAGTNTIYLSQSQGISPFQGLMYDYLRLEGPGY